MAKKLTILIPSMKIQSSVRLIFPRLLTGNKELVVGTFKQQVLPHIDLRNRVLIRWGSYYETADIAGSITYNSLKSVIQSTNKRLSRQMLSDAGVSVPRLVAPGSADIRYPLIARPEFHSLGRDFIIVRHGDGFLRHYAAHAAKHWYYSEYVDKVREYRVHVGHGKILCILEKPGSDEKLNWNSVQTNVPSVLLQPEQWDLAVVRESLKAAKVMDMDFAGVDVIVDRAGKAYVVELNTIPRMLSDVHIQEQYALYFDWLGSSDVRRPHFDVSSANPVDYAWETTGRKSLTFLIPTMKIHPSLPLIFPQLASGNKEIVVATKEQFVLPHIDLGNRVLIRWGSSYRTAKIPGSITYNARISVRRADDKRLSRKTLSDAGVSVPRLVSPGHGNISYPLIARPRFHSWGKNLIVLRGPEEFLAHYAEHAPKGWYYSEYVDKVQEFRVHIGHGRVLSVLERFRGEGEFSWNSAQSNLPLSLLEPAQWNLSIIRECLKAIRVIGLDFAGVDVIVDQEGRVYILELNTKPSVLNTAHTQEKYVQYFDWLGASNTRRPHYRVESDDPEDYAWREPERVAALD